MSEMTLDDLLHLKESSARPQIVVHCGSTNRAMVWFERYRLYDTLEGHIVLTIGANKADENLDLTEEQATALDLLHLFKIDLADFVRVFNPRGYIGESTRREVEYAQRLGKPIWYLEP